MDSKEQFSGKKYRSEIRTQPKTIICIIWLIQHLKIFIDDLFFYSNMVAMIIRDTLLINLPCY